MAVFEQFPGNLLDLVQTVKDAPARRTNIQVLQLVQAAGALRVPNPKTPSLTQALGLSQTVTVGKQLNIAVVTPLWLQHRGARVRNLEVYQNFFAWHDARPRQPRPVVQSLVLTQLAKGQLGKPGANTLALGQSASFTIRKLLAPNSVLSLVGASSGYIANPRFIGGEIPPVTPAATVLLQFEATTLTLPSPEFGNGETLEFTRINRKTRGGDLMVFRDNTWPKDDVLSFNFERLTEQQSQDLLRFLAHSLGKDITLTDHESRKWIGYVLTPTGNVIQPAPRRSACDRAFAASFEFQVIVPFDQSEYITALYQQELGRDPATHELAQWNLVLDYGGRLPVAAGILRSSEGRTKLVKGWYVAYLAREALNGEEQGHVTKLLNGESEESTQSGILGSQEWYDRAQTAYGVTGTPDERFIKSLFVLLLSREPTTQELTDKLDFLATNGRILTAFNVVGSAERKTITVTDYYTMLLGRAGSGSEISGWVNTSLLTSDIRIGFEASLEYFNFVT